MPLIHSIGGNLIKLLITVCIFGNGNYPDLATRCFYISRPQLKVVNIDVNRKHRIVGQVLTSFFIFIVFYSNVCDVQGKIHLTDEV